jgi:hypothetical protein
MPRRWLIPALRTIRFASLQQFSSRLPEGDGEMFDPFDHLEFMEFDRNDLVEREMAHMLATITINWGRIESYIFAIVVSIDFSRKDWATDFFKAPALSERKVAAEKAIRRALEKSYPDFVTMLNDAFEELDSIQKRRNPLAHGIWSRGSSPGSFVVTPLKLQSKGSALLEQPIEVNLNVLADLLNDMQRLSQRLSSLGAEMMAHQQLKKMGKR